MDRNNEKNTTQTTSKTPTQQIGKEIEGMMAAVRERRRLPERRWYDNTFFDDGFHYKYISRLTGRMVDLQERANLYDPMRAIPKASKQIRGIANTLLQPQYIPVI